MEILLSFLSGVLSAAILAFVFSFDLKGFCKLFVDIAVGTVVLAVMSLCGVIPFNALNAFTVGLLGVPGLIAILTVVTFL